MQAAGADADFSAESQFAAIVETGAGVPHDGRGLHVALEMACRGFIPGEDGFGVSGAPLLDVGDRLVNTGDGLHGEIEAKPFVAFERVAIIVDAGIQGCEFG